MRFGVTGVTADGRHFDLGRFAGLRAESVVIRGAVAGSLYDAYYKVVVVRRNDGTWREPRGRRIYEKIEVGVAEEEG